MVQIDKHIIVDLDDFPRVSAVQLQPPQTGGALQGEVNVRVQKVTLEETYKLLFLIKEAKKTIFTMNGFGDFLERRDAM